MEEEEVGRAMNPFLLYVKKMELALSCPICNNLLREPMFLPCSHMFCSQCITDVVIDCMYYNKGCMDKCCNRCPLCMSTFHSRDVRASDFMERMVTIFRSIDDAVIPVSQALGFQVGESGRKVPREEIAVCDSHVGKKYRQYERRPRVDMTCMKTPPHESPALGCNNTDEDPKGSPLNLAGMKVLPVETTVSKQNSSKGNLQGSQLGQASNTVIKVSSKRNLLPEHNNTEENIQQGNHDISGLKVAMNNGLVSGSNSVMENSLGESTCNIFGAQPDNLNSCPLVSEEEPDSLGLLMDRLTSKDLNVRSNLKTEVAMLPCTDPLDIEMHHSENGNLSKSCINSSPTQANHTGAKRQKMKSKHGMEAKQKLTNEHKSEANKQLLDNSNHSKPEAVVKCAFCHFSKITKFTGIMLHYINGKPARGEVSQSDVKHFHQKCFEWAPHAYFEGETARNLEVELERASKIKCSRCGMKGAALRCYVDSCYRTYHVPCAIGLASCRWDHENFCLLCPSHSSCKLPCELKRKELPCEFKWKVKAKRSSSLHIKSKSIKKIYASASQTDHSVKPRQLAPISEEQHNEVRMAASSEWIAEEQRNELWMAAPGVCSKWMLCESDLSSSERVLLANLASLASVPVTGKWRQNVTHVIASTQHGACKRTLEVLMAILNGKWILTIDWVKACMEHGYPVAEEPYEISLDTSGVSNGPKNGRIRAMKKEPKIFTGLTFYFGDQFNQSYTCFLEKLVLAAGGSVMRKDELSLCVSSPSSSYIVYNEDDPEARSREELDEIARKRIDEIATVEKMTHFKVVGHLWFLDTIAACNAANDLEKGVIQC